MLLFASAYRTASLVCIAAVHRPVDSIGFSELRWSCLPCLPRQGVLSGLFPGTTVPIPVHTASEIDEILYTNVRSCRKLHQLMQTLNREQRGGWVGPAVAACCSLL